MFNEDNLKNYISEELLEEFSKLLESLMKLRHIKNNCYHKLKNNRILKELINILTRVEKKIFIDLEMKNKSISEKKNVERLQFEEFSKLKEGKKFTYFKKEF